MSDEADAIVAVLPVDAIYRDWTSDASAYHAGVDLLGSNTGNVNLDGVGHAACACGNPVEAVYLDE